MENTLQGGKMGVLMTGERKDGGIVGLFGLWQGP